MDNSRHATLERVTQETKIRLGVNLDGRGEARVDTGIGFFDHMLTAFARHGLIDVDIEVKGDLHVDGHHTVEDTGLVLGGAIRRALGDKQSITRFGSAHVPMDDALVMVVIDLSGRPYLDFTDFSFGVPTVGGLDTQLVEEFFRAFSNEATCNLHVRCLAGRNAHHIIEAAFKALGRALKEAVQVDARVQGVPSTKGVLA